MMNFEPFVPFLALVVLHGCTFATANNLVELSVGLGLGYLVCAVLTYLWLMHEDGPVVTVQRQDARIAELEGTVQYQAARHVRMRELFTTHLDHYNALGTFVADHM